MSTFPLWAEELLLREFRDGRSPSGKAPAFGAGIEGSNPSRPASFRSNLIINKSAVINLKRYYRPGARVIVPKGISQSSGNLIAVQKGWKIGPKQPI
jgi:hypothetical protein